MEFLLEKTRAMNTLIQKTAGQPVAFDQMAIVLSELTKTGVYIVGRRGKLLGIANVSGTTRDCFNNGVLLGEVFSDKFNGYLLNFIATQTNIEMDGLILTIVPIYGGGERLGTLIFVNDQALMTANLILAEYAATVTGIEILRLKTERIEKEARKKSAVQLALGVLSFSELEAIRLIFSELNGIEGFIVASKIAEKYKLTRSVIVNALRKLESAGVIEAKSLGMKGTYISITNNCLLDHLKIN
jgi:transcriptional pleiotropic repressor